MNNGSLILAGIITYNPEIERLRDNIDSILSQVGTVCIFDNHSDNIEIIESEFGVKCTFLENKTKSNVGVASALNEICRYAGANGFDWVLSLDQDSVCPANLIAEYQKYLDVEHIGMISPRIDDRNIGDIEPESDEGISEIDACITSASLVNIKAWEEVGGFWDDLFIDMVDFDICWSLRERGYHIYRVNTLSLLHEIGHSISATFRGNAVAAFNHSPLRYYYISRNTVAVGRKHNRRYQCFRWNLKRFLIVVKYEHRKLAKTEAMLLGIWDGALRRMGACTRKF